MVAKKKGTGKADTKAKDTTKAKTNPKGKAKASSPPSKSKAPPAPAKKKDEDIDLRTISRQMTRMEKKMELQENQIKELKVTNRESKKKISGLETKLETRIKREDLIMGTLGLNSRSQKGGKSEIRELNSSILTVEQYLLNTGNRIDNILSAIKNHREFLVKLNKRVYKVNTKEIIELQVDIISNSLTIMMLTGFDFDKSLLRDVDKLKKMMEAKEFELGKVKKKMTSLDKKFEEELERFDFKSIYNKKQDIPGYH